MLNGAGEVLWAAKAYHLVEGVLAHPRAHHPPGGEQQAQGGDPQPRRPLKGVVARFHQVLEDTLALLWQGRPQIYEQEAAGVALAAAKAQSGVLEVLGVPGV